jgi:hypothetical protein
MYKKKLLVKKLEWKKIFSWLDKIYRVDKGQTDNKEETSNTKEEIN